MKGGEKVKRCFNCVHRDTRVDLSTISPDCIVYSYCDLTGKEIPFPLFMGRKCECHERRQREKFKYPEKEKERKQ